MDKPRSDLPRSFSCLKNRVPFEFIGGELIEAPLRDNEAKGEGGLQLPLVPSFFPPPSSLEDIASSRIQVSHTVVRKEQRLARSRQISGKRRESRGKREEAREIIKAVPW